MVRTLPALRSNGVGTAAPVTGLRCRTGAATLFLAALFGQREKLTGAPRCDGIALSISSRAALTPSSVAGRVCVHTSRAGGLL